MNFEEQTFTYQSRIALDATKTALLDNYADLLCHVERSLFAETKAGTEIGDLKSAYLLKYGITARQFNSCRVQLEGKIESIEVLRNQNIADLFNKIANLEKKIHLLEKKQKNTSLHHKQRRLIKLKSKHQKLVQDKKENRISLCFGSKKLFRSQFDLTGNGYASHTEWLKDWKESRNDSFFVLGSKDETSGNQTCTASLELDGTITLRLRLPDSLIQDNKYLIIPNIKFEYGHENIVASLHSCYERNHLMKSRNPEYKNYGRALSYRFKRDKKGWRVFVSTPVSKPSSTIRQSLGAIGVDINVDHLAVAETDRFGNLVNSFVIPLHVYGKTTHQAQACIGDAVTKLVEIALKAKKPIVLEKLDFHQKKSELKEIGNPKYARMLSSFAYSTIINGIKSRAWRFGVEVGEVNPAYTSVIGVVKFAGRYGLSKHESAALCIARRYQRVSERLPRRLDKIPDGKNGHVALPVPVRKRVKHVWALWRIVKKNLSAVHAAHFRAAKSRSSNR